MSIPVFPEVWEAMDHDNHWSLAYTGIVDLYSVIIHIMMCHVFVYFIWNYGAYTKDEFTSHFLKQHLNNTISERKEWVSIFISQSRV